MIAALASSAAELRDDRGRTMAVPAPAERIIALSPHLAEIVFAAGAEARLVGVVRYSDYPAAAKRLPSVGDASRIDLERVIALEPDLILGWRSGNPAFDVERMQRLGLRVFMTEPRRIADIARLLRVVGELAGSSKAADAAATELERALAELRTRYSKRRPVRVFYEIWHQPLLTINGEHLINDVVELCGGVNIFARAAALTPSVSLEAVMSRHPEVVLGGSSAGSSDDLIGQWRRQPITALRDLPVHYVPPDLIQRQTPRIAEGARMVCAHLERVRGSSVNRKSVNGKPVNGKSEHGRQ
jgi:iron complex transport system substrate-binding protein